MSKEKKVCVGEVAPDFTLPDQSGTPAPLADAKALAIVNVQVTRQALMLSFEQLFLLFGACFVLSLPLLLLMHKSKGMPGGAGAH